ncbi:MAG TPA: hypothetical protein VME45_15460 [Stellaceae bacterium]|nr:hypothetical protein [Stellaceae bacterium]
MNHAPIDDDMRRSAATSFPRSSGRSFRCAPAVADTAERVALGMIARHGADAAREAAAYLNRMIDRGDFAARDLWACVVHLIHERRGANLVSDSDRDAQ